MQDKPPLSSLSFKFAKFKPSPPISPPPIKVETPKPRRYIRQFQDSGEEELWRAFSISRDRSLRESLILKYQAEANRIANKYHLPDYSLSSVKDLRSAAISGMIQAVDAFDINKGVKFIVFARPRIRGAITDQLRELMDFPRIIAKNRRNLKPRIQQLHHKLGHEPSVEEIEEHIGPLEAVIASDPLFKSGVFNQVETFSAENGEKITAEEWIIDYRGHRKSSAEYANLQDIILGMIENEDERIAIIGYYYMDLTFAQIARSLGKGSVSTAIAIHKKALQGLKKKITSEQFKEMIGM